MTVTARKSFTRVVPVTTGRRAMAWADQFLDDIEAAEAAHVCASCPNFRRKQACGAPWCAAIGEDTSRFYRTIRDRSCPIGRHGEGASDAQ